MKKIIFLLLVGCLVLGQVAAQTKVVGKVTSADDGQPVAFATVTVKDAANAVATTADDGSYSITVPKGGTTLVFSFVGLISQEVAIAGRTTIDATLQSDATVLEDVVVIAYGTAKKGGFTGSALSIDSKQIQTRPVTAVTSVLEGSTGILSSGATGQPGSSPDIRIRGFGSINASNNPLIVVDGFPFDGGLSDINPGEIENITVLKDASASALYGSRAANGVIMITTKRGRSGTLSVNFRTNHGFSQRSIPEYDRIGAYDYVPLMWENMYNGLISGGRTPASAAATASTNIMGSNGLGYNVFGVANGDVMLTDGTMNPNARITYGDYDWEDAMTRTGYRGEYLLDASGGTEKVTYMLSLGYLNEMGYVINSDIKRMNARASVDVKPVKWFKAGVTLTGVSSESNNSNTDSSTGYNNPFYFSRMIAPIYPIYRHNTDGTYAFDENGDKIYEWEKRSFSLGRHIVAETKWNTRKYERNTIGTRAYGEFIFMEGLKFTLNAGFDQRNSYYTGYDNPRVGDGSPAGRQDKTYFTPKTWNFNQLLTYDKSFDLHNIQLLAGHESYDYTYNYLRGFKTGVILEWNPELVNFTDVASLTSYKHQDTHEGYLFRAAYDYDNKYYLSASYRRDGSSRFHKDVRWGNFWSVGASWRLDREKFMNNVDWVDMLKVRAAYGETGNDRILDTDGYATYYPWQDLFNIQRNGGTPGYIMSELSGNSKLEWEKNSTLDVAVEFSFLDRRLHGSVGFYHRVSDNLLFNVPMPVSAGMDVQPQNIGKMYNQGFEIDLTGDIVRAKDFRWNANLNMSTVKNEITRMPNGQPTIINGTKQLQEGHSMYDFWLRTYVGVNPTNGAAMYLLDENSNYGTSSYTYEGKLVTENQNYAKYEYQGSAVPDLYGGIKNTFTYKNLSLSILLSYSLGGKIYDGTYAALMSSGSYGSAKHKDILKRWKNPGDITDVPKMDNTRTSAHNAASSRWLTNASYLNFRNVTLSYNLPKSFVQKLDLSNIQTYVSAENIHLFTHRKGMNPTQNFQGTQTNVYIPSRVITFGLNISF